jgi:hypothetical protein
VAAAVAAAVVAAAVVAAVEGLVVVVVVVVVAKPTDRPWKRCDAATAASAASAARDDAAALRLRARSVSRCQKYVSLGALRTRSPRVSRACIFDLNTHRPTTPSSDRQTDISECH